LLGQRGNGDNYYYNTGVECYGRCKRGGCWHLRTCHVGIWSEHRGF
jgi:hypothetical protein